MGDGDGFNDPTNPSDKSRGRLAFRAILERPTRQTYIYYVYNQTLYQETRSQEALALCAEESTRPTPPLPDPNAIALTPPIVQSGGTSCITAPWRFFCYYDETGAVTTDLNRVHSVRVTLTVQALGAGGQLELQTFQTAASVRGP
jgi:hypothetical protein